MTELARGQWVYVHPDESSAPREVLGLAGTVAAVAGDNVTVAFQGAEHVFMLEVDAAILQRERRRRDRPPVNWSDGALIAAG